jgi:hypothetical protein
MSKDFTETFLMQGLPILVGILLILYTIYHIRKEDLSYEKNSRNYFLHGFKLKVPLWWSVKSEEKNCLVFERQDTRYDWIAMFKIIPKKNQDILTDFEDYVKEKNILFDPGPSVIHGPKEFSSLTAAHPSVKVVRVESTATANEIERIYYDLACLSFTDKDFVLICESTSSVLNGLIEGPFFEKVLKNIEYEESVSG